jgi:hypothetical protein
VGGDAGVVDKDVEAAELVARRFDCAFARRGVDDVASNDNCALFECGNFAGDLLKTVLASGDENQVDAAASKFNRERSADTAGRAGDECAAVGKWTVGHGRGAAY